LQGVSAQREKYVQCGGTFRELTQTADLSLLPGPAPMNECCQQLLHEVEGVGGQPVSAQTIRRTLHQIGLHGCRPRRKPLLKMMHKKARKQFAEDKQTKDMDYWNHVLWSDETKINLFGSGGVQHVCAATR
ncbi:hypothetical protein L3Q82_021510, partial [Scortum barcoo]